MAYEITLSLSEIEELHTVIVTEITFKDQGHAIQLLGLDPSLYPAEIRDKFRFFSRNLTAVPKPETTIESIIVKPTDKDVPTPDVRY